jgi:hypothetical protein
MAAFLTSCGRKAATQPSRLTSAPQLKTSRSSLRTFLMRAVVVWLKKSRMAGPYFAKMSGM